LLAAALLKFWVTATAAINIAALVLAIFMAAIGALAG